MNGICRYTIVLLALVCSLFFSGSELGGAIANETTITIKNGTRETPVVYLFFINETQDNEQSRNSLVWYTAHLAVEDTATVQVPAATGVEVVYGDGNHSPVLWAEPGRLYVVEQDEAGIEFGPSGRSDKGNLIEVESLVNIKGGIRVNLIKAGNLIMTDLIESKGGKVEFAPPSKLIGGLAVSADSGQPVTSVRQLSRKFFELGLGGAVTVVITGNAPEGYQFEVMGE